MFLSHADSLSMDIEIWDENGRGFKHSYTAMVKSSIDIDTQ